MNVSGFPGQPGNDTRDKTRLSRSVNEEGRSVVSRPAALRASGVWTYFLLSIRVSHDIFRDVTFQKVGYRSFVDFLPKQSNQVERRRSGCLFSPFWQRNEIMSASRSERFQASQKQKAITGSNECRLSRDRLGRPNLSISDANSIFLFTMVNLNLPAVKIALQQCLARYLPYR